MNTEFITILILLVYIGVLHFQLYKKNSFIESLVRKQLNIESALSKEGLEDIIKQLKGFSNDTQVKKSKLFEREIQKFILEDWDKQVLFIHYTKDEDVVKRIVNEGFLFADSFYKTAEAISNDKLDLVYKHNLRKNFGKFVVIIAIDKNVYNHYLNAIANSNKVLSVEQILSKKHPQLNENLDEVFLLPNQYVKGYVNIETGEIFTNNAFNPSFDSPDFEENLRQIN